MGLTLDVGCGNDFRGDVNVDLLVSDDIWQSEAVTCNKKVIPNFVQASAYFLPFKKGAFTKVVCHHTIEHLNEPFKALEEMRRVSKANGKITVIFPNRFLELIHALVFKREKLKWLKQHHHKLDLNKLQEYGDLSICSVWEYKLEVRKYDCALVC